MKACEGTREVHLPLGNKLVKSIFKRENRKKNLICRHFNSPSAEGWKKEIFHYGEREVKSKLCTSILFLIKTLFNWHRWELFWVILTKLCLTKSFLSLVENILKYQMQNKKTHKKSILIMVLKTVKLQFRKFSWNLLKIAQHDYVILTFELQFHKKLKMEKFQISSIENNLRDSNALLNFYDIIKLLSSWKFHSIGTCSLISHSAPCFVSSRHAVETT